MTSTITRRSTRRNALMASAAIGALFLAACGGTSGGEPTGGEPTGGAITGGATSAPAPSGETVTLHLATMVQETTPHFPVISWFFDELEARSEGRITIDRTAPESICKAPEIAECVRDGRADIGVTIPDYTPQLFPTTSVVSLPFTADNASAVMSALYQLNMESADAQAVWEKNGLELVGAWPVGRMIMGSKTQIKSIDDLTGVRMRATGPYIQKSFEIAGANVIAMPAAETYEGINSGVADAVAWSFDGPVDYKLMELLSYWTDPGIGHYTVFSMWINRDVYLGMPDDLRAIFDEVRDDFNSGEGIKLFTEGAGHQCTSLLGFEGVERFDRWTEEATAEWSGLVGTQMQDLWVAKATEDGLANAQQYLDDYIALLADLSAAPDLVTDPVIACVDEFLASEG